MDELIEALFGLAAIVVVAIAAAAVVAITLSIGGVYGAGVSIANYFKALKSNIKLEKAIPGTRPTPGSDEPAIKSYFFGKGFRDLKATIVASHVANMKFSEEIRGKAAAETSFLPRVTHYGAALSCMIYGTLFFGLLSLIHIIILGISYVVIYILFTLVYVVEKIYLTFRGFLTVCPTCHAQTALPIYLCDKCGAEHRKLLPSSYGIFHHQCSVCDNKLPATFFMNRGRLPAKCPECEHFLSRAHTEAPKSFVPVIGGPSTGKSAYLVWLVDELKTQASGAGKDLEFLNSAEQREFEARLQAMRRGTMPVKTTSTTPTAVNLTFSQAGFLYRNLYLYDPAGEAFGGEAELLPNQFLSYCSGILFLIDPFSIPAVQKQYGIDLRSALRPSILRPDDLLDRLLFVLEKHFGVDPSAPVGIPIAVVLTKVDAFDLEKRIGEAAISPHLAGLEREIALSAKISSQLRDWDMVPLVEVIERRFDRKCFFTCSSVGLNKAPRAGFTPERIGTPFAWLMRQAKIDLLSAGAAATTGILAKRYWQPRYIYSALAAVLLLAAAGLATKLHLDDEALHSDAGKNLTKLQNYQASCMLCWRRNEVRTEIGEQEERIYQAARGNLARLQNYLATCSVCSNKHAAQSEIVRLEQDEATGRESRLYQSARGNLGNLRNYVASCKVCAYKQAAETEILQLEKNDATAQENRQYQSARNNLGALRGYVANCRICTYKQVAQTEISQLELSEATAQMTAQEQRQYTAARGNLGNLRSYLANCKVCASRQAAQTEIAQLELDADPSITFNVTNNHPNSVEMVFHSATDKTRMWPGGGQVYVIRDSIAHTYRLSCTRGENVCYGAWVEGSPLNSYWGTGYKGRESCQNCCVTCPAQATAPIVLGSYNSRQPTPSLTWLIRSNFSYSVDVVFYSSTRRGLSWPGNNRVWTITNSDTQSYKLTCLAGERICYGAWPRGDASRYWGVGFGGQQGCSNCCFTCNGGETSTIELN